MCVYIYIYSHSPRRFAYFVRNQEWAATDWQWGVADLTIAILCAMRNQRATYVRYM